MRQLLSHMLSHCAEADSEGVCLNPLPPPVFKYPINKLIYKYEHIDKIHIKFCKNILGVRTQSPNYAVYGDLGRYSLSVIAKERSIKFWLKILAYNNSLTFNLFQTQIDDLDALAQPGRFKHKRSWAHGIKSLLDNLGFSQMWHNQLIEVIRNRIRDHFTQHWYANICNSSKL